MSDLPVIPGYRIERELGTGGMATVYLGVQEKLNRKVAIKVLNPLLLVDPNFAKRFLKEAETAANLAHSGIMTIHDVGQSGNFYYIVMEYIEGGSLRERILRGAMDPEQALAIVRSVASALDYAHCMGYVHRDIKPDNIMFRKDGAAVITDFGIARAIDSATKLTKTGMSIGTPHYMSPEQARGQSIDGRSDIYALGVVFFEMLTGKVPFDASDSIAIAVKHIQEPVPRLSLSLNRYQGLLDGMLDKEPERRVQSGAKVCELVDTLLGVRTTPAAGIPVPRPAPKARREGAAPAAPVPSVLDMAEKARPVRNPLVPVLAIALVVLVVVLIIVSFQGQSGRVEHGAPGGAPSQVVKTSDDDAAKKREQDLQNQLAAQRAENERLQREQAAREQAAHEETARQAQDEARRQAEADRQRQAQEEAQRQAAQEEARRKAAEEAERQVAAARAASQRRSDGGFTDNGDGTVTDSRTGLMWAAKDNGSDINWDDAKRYCDNYTGGGHSDWRMPTISELQGLYDTQYSQNTACGWAAHLTSLIHLTCSWVWSSETSGSSDARHFGFSYGFAGSNSRSYSGTDRALPVRSR